MTLAFLCFKRSNQNKLICVINIFVRLEDIKIMRIPFPFTGKTLALRKDEFIEVVCRKIPPKFSAVSLSFDY